MTRKAYLKGNLSFRGALLGGPQGARGCEMRRRSIEEEPSGGGINQADTGAAGQVPSVLGKRKAGGLLRAKGQGQVARVTRTAAWDP